MELTFAEARGLAIEVLHRHGMPEDHAGVVADHLVDAACAGHAFAGLPRVLAIVEQLRTTPAGGPITFTRKGDRSVQIDGGGNVGYVTSLLAIDEATKLARAGGMGVVGVNNTWFSGRLAYYVERAARAGFIAVHTASTQARVAPSGGIDRIFGTNPVAFAFPGDPDPLVIDFGTGMTTWGEALLRLKLGRELEDGAAVDSEGRPTRDPAAALAGAFLPWGGHRGYGLSLVVQVMALLCGGETVARAVADSGFFFLVIDPEVLTPASEFRTKVGALVEHIENSRPAPGQAKVRVPGRQSILRREAALARGVIDVDPSVHEALQALRAG